MGFFDSIGSVFNPSNWAGSGGNSLLDLMDPGNTFHTGASQRAADRQFSLEQKIAQENLALQKEQYEYQKSLNDLQMEREDTATQRRVADLRASGLSPTLAAGSAAAAAPMHAGTAPQRSVPSDVKVQAAMFKENLMRDRMQLAATLMGNIANVAKTAAETQLMKAQTDNITSMTPVDLKLKEQAYEFAAEANVYKLKSLALDVPLKEKRIDIENWNIILDQDEHARNALIYFQKALENELLEKDVDLKDREYILKGLAIDASTTANAKLELEYKNLQYDTDFYHTRGMPVGFNMGLGAPLFGASAWAHKALGEAGSFLGDKFGKGAAFTGDFVSRMYKEAQKAARKLTKGVFDFSQ